MTSTTFTVHFYGHGAFVVDVRDANNYAYLGAIAVNPTRKGLINAKTTTNMKSLAAAINALKIPMTFVGAKQIQA